MRWRAAVALAIGGLGLAGLVLAACPSDPAAPPPRPVPPPPPPPALTAPEVAFRLPERQGTSPVVLPADPALDRTRERLLSVVRGHARDPGNPWAIVHAMLALGPDERLSNGEDPVDWLFSHYAEVDPVGGEDLPTFPTGRGEVRIEPHTDLVLKALTEGGVPPGRSVALADGRRFPVGALYRHSLVRSWVTPSQTGFQQGAFNDTPWALQGLAAWGPDDLEWTALGNRKMSLDAFTGAVVDKLVQETAELSTARAEGRVAKKDNRIGIFTYTCGGAHLLMGAAYAVGRGFGDTDDRAKVCDEHALWRYRIDVELAAIDPLLGRLDPGTTALLLSQRLKFLGHWLEATHKTLAMGVCPPTADDAAANRRVVDELVRTVEALDAMGAFAEMPTMRTDPKYAAVPRGPEQLYLDLVGDSAHALRGLDLATGRGTVAY